MGNKASKQGLGNNCVSIDPQTSPIGFVESFVFSNDRRSLISNALVVDSEDSVYYTLIQLENEIQDALMNDMKRNKIINEMNSLVKKVSKANHALHYSTKIKRLIFRHHLRMLNVNGYHKVGWASMKEKLFPHKYPTHERPQKKRLAHRTTAKSSKKYMSVNCTFI